MSQEKVARYKEEKANRKTIMRKQKIARIVRNSVAGVVLVAVAGWLGYSGITTYIENRPRKTVEVDYAALNEYETSLAKEGTEETTDSSATETE